MWWKKLEDSVPDIMSYQYYGFLPQPMPLSDQVFFAQADVIRRVAAEGPCVIVGRCADYILRQHPRCLHFFIHAPLAQRVSRVMEREHCTEAEARAHIKATDRNRAAYHEFYAQGGWGKAENYHAALSSAFGTTQCTEALVRLIDLAEEQGGWLTGSPPPPRPGPKKNPGKKRRPGVGRLKKECLPLPPSNKKVTAYDERIDEQPMVAPLTAAKS